jgi:D-amino-acid dehydrogenase
MKVIVLGAGVIGVTSAYYLAKAGHAVTVVERRPGVALETSFANGSQVSASHAEPWANPKTPGIALKWLGRRDAPMRFPFRLDPAQWAFGLRFLLNCAPGRARANTERNWRLARYSRDLHGGLNQALNISHDLSEGGILHLFRDPRALQRAAATFSYLGGLGCGIEALDAGGCVAREPALEVHRDTIAGGFFCAEDSSGDCHKFSVGLAEACEQLGVTFRFATEVRVLKTEAGRFVGVATSAVELAADACVVALGCYGRALLKPHGIALPIYPAKGYSVTVPTAGYDGAPRISVTDEAHRLVYSPLGDRLRIAGTAAFTGYDTAIDTRAVGAMLAAGMAEFPGCGDASRAEFWTGLRPLMPDCVPLIGATPVAGLYLNTGHGSLGWTMCCGSGKLLADIVSGAPPEIDPTGLGLDRLA